MPGIEKELQPGTSMMVLATWGDIVEGYPGIVALREKDDVVLFGHGQRNVGPTLFALARAPVLGVAASQDGVRSLVGVGSIVGSVWYDGSRGFIGTIGDHVPSCDVSVSVGDGLSPVTFSIALDPQEGVPRFRRGLWRCFSLWEPTDEKERWRIAIGIDDIALKETVAVANRQGLFQAVLSMVGRTSFPSCRTVTIEVSCCEW